MTTLAVDNFHRFLALRAGVITDGTARIQNVTKSVNVCGYLEPKTSENLFKSMHIMNGIFSALLPSSGSMEDGDLIYDRFHGKYGYVTEFGADDPSYQAMVYMCNSQITIAHPTVTQDWAKRDKATSWTTTVHHTNLRALITLENYLAIEKNTPGSKADNTKFYCYVGFDTVVHQGDRVYDGTHYYLVNNIDDVSWNGAIKCLEMGIINV